MRFLRKKKENEVKERLAFVYYACTAKGERSTVLTNEIANQILSVAQIISKKDNENELLPYLTEFHDNGCEEFIRKYGTYWSNEDVKKGK